MATTSRDSNAANRQFNRNSSRQKKRRRLWAVTLLILAVMLFVGGLWTGNSGALDTSAANQRLRSDLKTARRELEAARNELALYRTDTEVTREARETRQPPGNPGRR